MAMAKAGVVWHQSPSSMAERVDRYKKALLEAVYQLANEWASRLRDEARAARPWTDRTHAAERGLFGRAFRLAVGAVIVVGHGVHYGIYLERKNAGRYATIIPTMQRNYAAIMASLQQLVR